MQVGRKKRMDTFFLLVVLTLTLGGFLMFLSASTGLLTKESINFARIITTQSIALVIGLFLLFLFSHIHYRLWRKYAFVIIFLIIFINLLVFIPGLGFSHQGATRWLSLGSFTIQPSALLIFGFVIYCSTWLSGVTLKIQKFTFGLLPILMILGVISIILMAQRDTGSLVIIGLSGIAMFFIAGARIRDVLVLISLGFAGVALLAFKRPYIYDRFMTIFNPSLADTSGSFYQVNQSLITIGSGEWFGRGYGQSVQKFRFLPEPSSDSIFAVIGEELGFIGSFLLIAFFVALVWRGLKIAMKANDNFARLLVVGLVIMIFVQAFIHIGGMLNAFPLSGTPLSFVSLGGTALIVSLASMGIVLNVSRYSNI